MAYPLKRHTKTSYNASGFVSYQEIEIDKMYYMPVITDEANNYWTINIFNPVNNTVVLSLSDCEIRAGYRLLITELIVDSVSKYHIHVFNPENVLILDLDVDSDEYALESLKFVNSAYIRPVAAPAKPSALTAVVISKNEILLSWNDNSNNEASFVIQRSLNGTLWSEVASVNENVTSYSDTGLSPATSYQYRVVARNSYGDSSPTTKYIATTLPKIPTGPSNLIIKNVSQTEVEFNWLDNSDNEDGYVVQRSLDATNWTTIATLATPNVESYINTGLSAGTKYYYKVYAYNTGGNSESITESVTTLRNAPSAPSGLSSMVSGLNITLSWTDNSGTEDGFKIERSLYGSKVFQQIGTASSNATLYEDLNLESGTQYEYRIRAYNEGGNSAYSSTISATTMDAPNTPTNLVGTAVTESRIDISWDDNSLDETIFKVERSDDSGATWTQIATTFADEPSYKDYSVTTGTTYSYRVRAYNAVGNSSYSNTVTLSPLSVPEAPSNLVVIAASDTSIIVSWTDNSDDEVGFKLQRSLDGISSWGTVYTALEGETNYTDTGLTHSTTYHYRIFAYNDIGESSYSDTAEATTNLQTPTNLEGTVSGLNIGLTWNYDLSSQNGFKIERSLYGSKVWSEIATVAAQTTSYDDENLGSGTRYEYRIRAYNINGQSSYSNIIDVTTMVAPSAPSEFIGYEDSQNGYIEFMWSDLLDETGYILERSDNGGNTWSVLANIAADEINYKDYTAAPGVSYSYRIKGYNAVGDGEYSSVLNLSLPGVPDAPSNLVATVAGSAQINLTWTDNSDDEVGFKLQRTTDPSNSSSWATIYTAQAGETSYSDTGLNGSTSYYYRVFAYNNIGESSYSNESDAKTYLSAPINVAAASPNNTYILVTWENAAASTTGFKVERYASNTKVWVEVANFGANKFEYEDSDVVLGRTYSYRVRAYDADSTSDYSATVIQSIT